MPISPSPPSPALPEPRPTTTSARSRRAGERTAALSRDLLVIGQRHTAPQGSVEVDAVLADWLDALREKTGTARLETSFRSSGSKIAITPAALVRVVDNLVENAAEAIAEGGSDAGRSIGVSTRLVSALVETSIDAIVPAGMWLRLVVADDGCGMSDGARRHAFEPYFSTRPKIPGRTTGRGLGLAIVWGIVHQSGGHVGLASASDTGTFVRIYLPVVGS